MSKTWAQWEKELQAARRLLVSDPQWEDKLYTLWVYRSAWAYVEAVGWLRDSLLGDPTEEILQAVDVAFYGSEEAALVAFPKLIDLVRKELRDKAELRIDDCTITRRKKVTRRRTGTW